LREQKKYGEFKWIIFFITVTVMINVFSARAQIENINERPVPAKVNYDQFSDSVAAYKGGTKMLFDFIEKNFMLPDTGIKQKPATYLTIASFSVDSTGNVSKVSLTRPEKQRTEIPEDIKTALIDVLNKMPSWNPGYAKGRTVNSIVLLPLQFTVSDRRITLLTEERTTVPKEKSRLSGEKVVLLIGAGVIILALILFGLGGK
jgi:hypothetical protein